MGTESTQTSVPAGVNSAVLNAWIDGDFDGTFSNSPLEHILVDRTVLSGPNVFTVNVPLLRMPPPQYAELSEMVLFVTVSEPLL